MPSQFHARFQGDPLSETRTHADGIVGHISMGAVGRTDVVLSPDAKQLVVVEAKLFSPLSAGTRNAVGFDQAARNVACIAELLAKAGIHPRTVSRLSFFIAAPRVQIKAGLFSQEISVDSLRAKVKSRVDVYKGEKDQWLYDWFMPTLDAIRIEALAWEDFVAIAGREYGDFYARCLHFNQPIKSNAAVEQLLTG